MNCRGILISLLCLILHITAFTQLKADFSASAVSGCTPLVGVVFQDLSTGSPTIWEWDLGNGAISTKQNPSATYIDPGTYTVTLKVKNSSGEDSVTKVNYITVYPKPVVAFGANPVSGCLPLLVNFFDSSTTPSGTIESWIWDFGDGQASPDQNPKHIYNISDTFNVTLVVTNNFGCVESLLKPGYIAIADTVSADFKYTYTSICKPPALLNFINLSTSGSLLTYQWDFGDGGTSTQQNPSNNYTIPGTYNITLIAANKAGCTDTIVKSISIGTQAVGFILPLSACVNEPVMMQDSSVPEPISGAWLFGDGASGTGLSVTHTYTTPGIYQVQYRANFGGCPDGIRKSIKILDKPVSSFTSTSIVSACSVPLTVQFNNTSVAASTYLWDFGDGATSTDTNAIHTYTTSGSFTVTLIAYNSEGGCGDSSVKTNYVSIVPPQINGFTGLPFSGCTPSSVNFNPDITSLDPVVSYQWAFGDGGTSTDAAPTYTYTVSGLYDVTLIITTASGCTDSFTLVNAVTVNQKPVANFGAFPRDACASTPIQFTDSSSTDIISWKWVFGDGTGSFERNPLHQFQDTGFFTVTLYVSNNGCSDTVILTDYIHIKPPVASFAPVLNCSTPYTRQFTDNSVAPETWNWDFGDGSTTNEISPLHNYTDTGIYIVQLIVTNSGCADTVATTVYILDEAPLFDISAVNTNFCKYDTVKFTSKNYAPAFITSFRWEFNDGTATPFSPVYKNVSHIYKQSGIYNPILITIDLNGCFDTTQNSLPLNIFGPTAAFTNSVAACWDTAVIFKDASLTDGLHDITQWEWGYGDGISEILYAPPFQHNYLNAGTYDVKLVVYDTNGCRDTLLKPANITIKRPIADFEIQDSIRCTASKVFFTNFSEGLPLTYNWDFGDGNKATTLNPSHTYTAQGIYSVSLSVTDDLGCKDSISLSGGVIISNPKASFTISDSSSTCPPLPVQVHNNSQGYTSLFWDFGDGNTSILDSPFHFYTTPGKYNLILIAQGYGECADTTFRVINLKGPNGEFQYSPNKGCFPAEVSFSATAENTNSYIWDFGDGNKAVTASGVTNYKYKAPGIYVPKLILEDISGCQVPLENADTIKISGVFTLFGADVQTGCDSSLVVFTDSSLNSNFDGIKERFWNFGDGIKSTEINPIHFYTAAGNYAVSLSIATDSGCIGKYVLPINVKINKAPEITAIVPDSVCVNTIASFAVQDTANIIDPLTWHWNYGNGDSSNAQNPTYVYTQPGTFTVTVTSTANTTCADTLETIITALPPPLVNAGADNSICRYKTLTLQPSGGVSYIWATDPTLSCTNCANPVANPDTTTTYIVTGADDFGCKALDSVTITVVQPVIISLNVTDDTLCLGSSVQLNVTGAQTYTWQPPTGLSSSTIGNPVASPSTTTVYTVIGSSDAAQCFADTAQVSILVAPIPTFNILDTLVSINVGSSYQLKTVGSPDIASWLWIPPAGLSCNNCPAPLAQPKTNITYNVQASNIFGCTVADNVRFEVVCNNANIFIPNTFSPNGDTKNDYFYPRGKGFFTIKSMRIFNRWGALVFAKSNFAPEMEQEGWNGKYNGTDQPTDVYVYIIDVLCENGTTLSYKGNVTLIR